MPSNHASRARWLILIVPIVALVLALMLLGDEPAPVHALALVDDVDWARKPAEAASDARPLVPARRDPVTLRGVRTASRLDPLSPDVEAVDATAAAKPSPDYVDGVVVDAEGRAVAGARVSLRAMLDARTPAGEPLLHVEADHRGSFRLAPVPAGTFAVWAEADDHAPAWQSPIAPGARLELRLQAAGRLRVTAQDAAGRAVDGASVRVRRPGFFRDGTTNASGACDLGGLPAGPAELRVTTDDGGLFTRVVHIDPEKAQVVTCTLAPTTTYSGIVRERETAIAIEDAVVSLRLVDHPDLHGPEVRTDANGTFEVVAPVAAGARVEARVHKAGFADGMARLRAPADAAKEAQVVITLWSQRQIRGRVVDNRGRAVASARVWWSTEGEPSSPAVSDARGRFRIGLPAGAADEGLFKLAARTVRGATGTAHVPLDPEMDVEVVVVAAGRLAGTIRDVAGRPAEGALVALEPATGTETHRTVSDATGAYRLPALPAGTWRLHLTYGATTVTFPERVVIASGEAQTLDLSVPTCSTLPGRVIALDGGPVAGARVVARSPAGSEAALTDLGGRFRLDGLDASRAWTLVASAPGFAPERIESLYTGGRGLDIVLAPRRPVTGSVTLEGRPFADAFRIRLLPARTAEVRRGETIGAVPVSQVHAPGGVFEDPQGTFEVSLPEERTYLVQAVSRDGAYASAPQYVTPDTEDDLVLALRPAHATRGRVDLGTGTPASDAVVSLHATIDGAVVAYPLAATHTDAHGAYVLSPLPAGRYFLRIAGPHGETSEDLVLPVTGEIRSVVRPQGRS